VYVFIGPVQGEDQDSDLRVAAFDLRDGSMPFIPAWSDP